MPKTAKFRKTFKKRIIKPGKYFVPKLDEEGKVQHDATTGEILTEEVDVPESRIDRWLSNYQDMTAKGLRIPGPFRHDPKAVPVRLKADQHDVDSYNNGGFWDKLWKDKHGALWGQIEARSKEAAQKLKNNSVEDVSLVAKTQWMDGNGNQWEDALTHIALVVHPVAKDTDGFEEVIDSTKQPDNMEIAASFSFGDTLALSMSSDQTAGSGKSRGSRDSSRKSAGGGRINDGGSEINAAALTVKDIIGMLQELDTPLRLPDDTTADNFLERLGTVLVAVQAAGEGDEDGDGESIREPNSRSKEQPGPVAMSKELELSLDLLTKSGIKNPATGKPWTSADITAATQAKATVTTQLSAEDQATINFARTAVANDYKSKIERLVAQGKVTPAYAKTNLAPLLKDIQFAFDGEGKRIDNQLDLVLKALDAIPKASTLTGASPTSAKAQRGVIFGQQAFSLSAGTVEMSHELGDNLEVPDNAELGIFTDEEADALVDAQLATSGYSAGRVEGGFRSRTQK